MKSINTLIPDIQKLVTTKGWMTDDLSQQFASSVARRLEEQYKEQERSPTLRLSKMGPVCPKALWASIHLPEEMQPLPPWAEIKFSFGHIIEALVVTLAKAAGHEVTGEQDAVYVDGIEGHRDCVIDGCVVDIKSSSSRGFLKFKTGTIKQDDSFGYLDQLDAYVVGSLEDPLVRVKDKGYLLAIDKQLGHMTLYKHEVRHEHIKGRIADYKQIANLREPPACRCNTVADGKSGNRRLDVKASYSSYKYVCFPNLRTFLYASGPVYLTHVERLPDVPEIDRQGKILN